MFCRPAVRETFAVPNDGTARPVPDLFVPTGPPGHGFLPPSHFDVAIADLRSDRCIGAGATSFPGSEASAVFNALRRVFFLTLPFAKCSICLSLRVSTPPMILYLR